MESFTHYMAKAKSAVRRGRPTRKSLGMEPMQSVTTRVEKSVLEAIIAKYGTVNSALRHIASGIKKAS